MITNPQVIHETIDDETIVIDLASGTYYSLQGAGPVIWNAIAAGEGADAVADRLAAGNPEIAAAVRSFVANLQAEGLLDTNGSMPEAGPHSGQGPAADSPATFVPPTLEKYTDMQDIILLDPVHQVGERGWPHTDAAPA